MTRRLHNWTAENIIRFLRNNGFEHSHTRGSHMFYVGNVGNQIKQVCIPFHGSRSINPKTFKSIIMQSGISQKYWMEK